MQFFGILAASLALTGVSAHPGHDIVKEVQAREAVINELQHKSLSHCTDKIKRSGIEAQSIARRSALATELISKTDRALNPLDIHHNPHHPFTLTTPLTTIFGPSPSCLLAPDTTVGPFYLTGELIRSSLVESQPGVPLHLDLLVIDTSTCLPLVDPTVYIELWSANATGVYGGYSGPSNAPGDSDNVRSSWLRGAQPLDAETGTAQFDTIFPGHYPGRAPHVHVMVHRPGAVVGGNGTTIRDAVATHTGQLFFDQELVREVVGTWPYVENGSGELVRNEADYYVPLAERDGNDPFVSYVYLNGRDVGGGLLGWMTVGVDMSRQMNVRVAGTFRGGE